MLHTRHLARIVLLTAISLLASPALGQVALTNAERAAQNYLSFTAFSEEGLIDQLVFEGFSRSTARQAASNLNVDWREQAAASAQSYVAMTAFSRDGLVDQLMFEGFTREQATYGADRALGGGASSGGGGTSGGWESQAIRQAEEYLSFTAFSKQGLIDQLVFEGFTREQATYGVERVNADWSQQAVLQARSYLDMTAFSRSGLIDQLVFEGFTRQQATYAADRVGF